MLKMRTRIRQESTNVVVAEGSWDIGNDLPDDVFGEAVMVVMRDVPKAFANRKGLSDSLIRDLKIEVTFA